jgi:uncharacterized protein
LHDVLANDVQAVVLYAARAERAGKRWEDSAVNVQHLRDGKVTEVWTYPFDVYAFDEFWS